MAFKVRGESRVHLLNGISIINSQIGRKAKPGFLISPNTKENFHIKIKKIQGKRIQGDILQNQERLETYKTSRTCDHICFIYSIAVTAESYSLEERTPKTGPGEMAFYTQACVHTYTYVQRHVHIYITDTNNKENKINNYLRASPNRKYSHKPLSKMQLNRKLGK